VDFLAYFLEALSCWKKGLEGNLPELPLKEEPF